MRVGLAKTIALTAGLLLSGCGGAEPAPSEAARPAESPRADDRVRAAETSEAPPDPGVVGASADPRAQPTSAGASRCPATTTLEAAQPTWVASLAAAEGVMQRMISCETRSNRPGPLDLFGLPTAVRCDPPRVCSAGLDGVADTDDDVCAPAESGTPSPLVVESSMRPGCASPAQAVLHFYASWLRGDEVYLEALAPREQWGPGIETDVNAHRAVTIERVSLDLLRCTDESHCRFRVTVEISGSPGGPVFGELTAADGGWYVSEIPG